MIEALRLPPGSPGCRMEELAELFGRPPFGNGCLKSAVGRTAGVNDAWCVKCLQRRRALSEWLSLPLLDKRTDLETYLDSAVPAPRSYPLQPSTILLNAAERPLASRSDLPGSGVAPSLCCPITVGAEASEIQESGWRFSCSGSACEAAGSPNQMAVRHCPSRFSYLHYLAFAPPWMSRPARKLFVCNLTAVLGAIRAERCVFPDSRVSLSPVRTAVQIIHQTKGSVQSRIETMSRQVYLSASYLAVLFTRVVGTCFRQYVRSVRLAYAADSLVNSDNRISAISAALGYTELSNFVRDFRSGLGICPAKLRSLHSHEGFVWSCPSESG